MPARAAFAAASRSLALGAAGIALLLATAGGAAADDLVTLKPGEAAIIFIVDGQGRGGDLQVRGPQDAALWASVVSQTGVCQFTVRPGAYKLILAPDQKPIALSAVAGHATVVSLAGETTSGAYRFRAQQEVVPGDIDKTPLPQFIAENRIEPAGYAPTSLAARGDDLTFVFRTDF